MIHVRNWLVNSVLDSVDGRMDCTDNNHVTDLWNTLLDASYRVHSRLLTIDGLGMLLMFFVKSLLPALWLIDDSAAVSLHCVLTRDQMTIFCVFQLVPFVVLPCHLMIDTCALVDNRTSQAIDRSRRHHTLQFTYMSHRS